ncbi:proton-associated sugar transporter A-like [Episyrphus balteatus]|uniref:proton-associated sugar transporter A-like n=1 Tax=Episyrphus balteatus TaxID=286459 RepID=UPI002485CBE8|nr:proton-associated sugar transporter A-like [Episyrphus balteatus]XP_055854052.1 proton-associated sugar transporter A-like [Episyrphus balteatus]XP_055854053.1 proton-associated sugar transporter A-like [Episyrphus balteatus]XP_055854054.1 proton-associated sugar transporter A-like [Episyrphus balteatus]
MTDVTDIFYESVYTKMLEAREKHASIQKKDYSHVFRKKSFIDILRLSALAIGIGFVYAAETAFVSPTLLKIGVDHATMTMVWGLSPVLGLLLGPFIGSLSDRCNLNLGRRRPIILLLALGIAFGFIFLPFGRNIGEFFGDDVINMTAMMESNSTNTSIITTLPANDKPNLKIAIILTVLGTMMMDFCAETSQSPARAYMLDVCIAEDHNFALSSFSVMAGLGSAAGYCIGGINWESTAIGQLLGGNIQAAFMIDAFFFLVGLLITVASFREIPLPLMERDKMLRPLVTTAIKDEFPKKQRINNSLLEGQSIEVNGDNKLEKFKDPDCFEAPSNPEVETVSLAKYLKSIVVMPKSMWILCLTNFLSWMGHICYCVYFTDFVGEEVFHGDPTAPVTSEEYKLYEDGVRYGGWGMAIYALSCALYSLIIEKLMDWFKPKCIYIFGLLLYAIGMFLLAFVPSKIGVLLLSITAGIFYATIYTIPFILVANYHASGCFEISNGKTVPLKQPRGLGTDMAIVSSMLFIAQLSISLGLGSLVSWMGTTRATYYTASGFSVCAAISAMFVLYI